LEEIGEISMADAPRLNKILVMPPLSGLNLHDNPLQMSADYAISLTNFMPPTTKLEVRPGIQELLMFEGTVKALYSYITGSMIVYADSWWDYSIETPASNQLLLRVQQKDGSATMYAIDPNTLETKHTLPLEANDYNNDYTLFNNIIYFSSNNRTSPPYMWKGTEGFKGFAWEVTDKDGNTGKVSGLDNLTLYNSYIYGNGHETMFLYYVAAQNADGNDADAWDDFWNIFFPTKNNTGSFNLARHAKLGGYILKMFTMSSQNNYALQNYFCALTSNGELLVYTGAYPPNDKDYDPTKPDTNKGKWELMGNFRIPVPLNRNCICTMEGDVVIATVNGFVSLYRLIFGKTSPITEALEYRLSSLFQQYQFKIPSYRNFFFLKYFQHKRLLIFNVPIDFHVNLKDVKIGYEFGPDKVLTFEAFKAEEKETDRYTDMIKNFIFSYLLTNFLNYEVSYELTPVQENVKPARIQINFTTIMDEIAVGSGITYVVYKIVPDTTKEDAKKIVEVAFSFGDIKDIKTLKISSGKIDWLIPQYIFQNQYIVEKIRNFASWFMFALSLSNFAGAVEKFPPNTNFVWIKEKFDKSFFLNSSLTPENPYEGCLDVGDHYIDQKIDHYPNTLFFKFLESIIHDNWKTTSGESTIFVNINEASFYWDINDDPNTLICMLSLQPFNIKLIFDWTSSNSFVTVNFSILSDFFINGSFARVDGGVNYEFQRILDDWSGTVSMNSDGSNFHLEIKTLHQKHLFIYGWGDEYYSVSRIRKVGCLTRPNDWPTLISKIQVLLRECARFVYLENSSTPQDMAMMQNTDISIVPFLNKTSVLCHYASDQYVFDSHFGTWSKWEDVNMVDATEHNGELFFVRVKDTLLNKVIGSSLCKFNEDFNGDFEIGPKGANGLALEDPELWRAIHTYYVSGATDLQIANKKKFKYVKIFGTSSTFWNDEDDAYCFLFSNDFSPIHQVYYQHQHKKPPELLKLMENRHKSYGAMRLYLARYRQLSDIVKFIDLPMLSAPSSRISIGSESQIMEHNIVVYGYELYYEVILP
jgi:hypothetical protein